MASSQRERGPIGTPGREDAVRPHLEDRSDELLSSGDDVDVDAAWHEEKEVPYVPVGETFEVQGVLFNEDVEVAAAAAQDANDAACEFEEELEEDPAEINRRSSRTTPTSRARATTSRAR